MVIKSSQRSGGKQLPAHLMADENERAEVVDSHGVFSRDVAGILAEFEAVAKGTQARKHLYHVSVSPQESATMSPKDWARTWQLHDQTQGLNGLPFVEVEHEKHGRTHRHRVYTRIDPQTGKARNLDWTRIKNERIARQLEVELGHTITPGKHNRAVLSTLEGEGLTEIAQQLRAAGLASAAPAIPLYTHMEWQAAKRGAPIDQVREALAEAWHTSDSPQAFEAALAAQGFAIAQGDTQPVVVGIDGQVIPLLRAIKTGQKKAGQKPIKQADLAARLAGQLPDVDAVREAQAERQAQQIPQQPGQPQEVDVMNPTEQLPYIGRLSPAGKAEEAIKAKDKPEEDNPKWIQLRERMLYQHYGQALEGTDFARYWKVERGQDGLMRFRNKQGEIIDRGEVLHINTKKHSTPAVAAAAIELAIAKGWDNVRATGSDEFKQQIFIAAHKAGLPVTIESEHDKQLYELTGKCMEINIEPAPDQQANAHTVHGDQAQGFDMEKVRERYRETGKEQDAKAVANASKEAFEEEISQTQKQRPSIR